MAGLGAVLLQAQELGVSEVLPVLDSTPAKWLGAGAIAAALKLRSSHPELKSQQ
ncbi:MAG: hypothetical protein GY731_08880 [Gammaproteobacteria bacterium]|nr:hypothetical protein [Gammaproteobacteria bacterium]